MAFVDMFAHANHYTLAASCGEIIRLYFFLVALLSSVVFAGVGSQFFDYGPGLVVLYSLGVGVAVAIFRWKIEFGFSLRWSLAGVCLPIVYVGLVYLVGWQFFDYELQKFSETFLYGLPLILVASFLEEMGWRGFLFEALQKIGWVRMNLFIGVLWAAWHYPAIFSGSYDVSSPMVLGVGIFTLNVVLLSFIFGSFRQKTGGIIAPTLMHSFHNITYIYWAGESGLPILSESGLVLSVVLLVVIVGLRAWRPKTGNFPA